jgi:hypothetical protein
MMAERSVRPGLVYIDCPVTGLPEAAAAGKLTLLVGADAVDLEKARPYLVSRRRGQHDRDRLTAEVAAFRIRVRMAAVDRAEA